MVIAGDKNQFAGSHGKSNARKHSKLRELGVELMEVPLPVGDYIFVDDKVQEILDRKAKRNIPVKKMDLLGTYKVAVDSKASIQELAGNICGKDHERIRDEMLLSKNNGIRLVYLIEDDQIDALENLHRWANPRLFLRKRGKQMFPNAVRGVTLMKACMTCRAKYGCEFVFCKPKDAATKIVEILTGGKANGTNDS